MDLSPSDIRRQRFEQVRRGFDPQEVGLFLERVAEMVARYEQKLAGCRLESKRLERQVEEARSAEEAVRLTMVAASKAKEEMVAAARDEAEKVIAEAARESEAVVSMARREALKLMEEARNDSDQVLGAAKAERDRLYHQSEGLRETIKKTSTLLKGMASGAIEELSQAASSLDAGNATDFELVTGDRSHGAAQAIAADPVDSLLTQLRAGAG